MGEEAAGGLARDGVWSLMQKAYESLKSDGADRRALAAGALAALDEALKIDFENAEVIFAQRCLIWWLDKLRNVDEITENYNKGAYILAQLKPFSYYIKHIAGGVGKAAGDDNFIAGPYDTCIYAVKHFVCMSALRYYDDILGDGINAHDTQTLSQIGMCYKGLGNYEAARHYFEQAARFERENARILAALADVKALLGEEKTAKALFREAFYLDPAAIDLSSLEAGFITRLVARLEAQGYSGATLCEWLPVYGALFGVFSVKREMKSTDLRRLTQDIFALENEVKTEAGLAMVPRLVNKYLWLIDYYSVAADGSEENRSLIEQTRLKIRMVAPELAERYLG